MPHSAFGLSHDAWGRLILIDAEGRRHVGVEPVRAFPLTDPGHWISFVDEHGHEVAQVEDLASLRPAVRRLLEEELARREFLPAIRRILRITGETLPCEWDVETDRGPTRFTVESQDQVRRLGADRVLIADSRGLRYQIREIHTLDPSSRRLLERFL